MAKIHTSTKHYYLLMASDVITAWYRA